MFTKHDLKFQEQNVKELMKLIKENPELPIAPMVDSEVVSGDEHSWWISKWGSATIEEIYNSGDCIHLRSVDEDILIEDVYDNLEWEGMYKDELNEEQLYKMAEKIVNSYNWKKVIAVRIIT